MPRPPLVCPLRSSPVRREFPISRGGAGPECAPELAEGCRRSGLVLAGCDAGRATSARDTPPCAQSLGGAPGQGEVLPVDAGAVIPIGRGVEAVISRLRVRGSPWRGFSCTAFFDSAPDALQRFFVATGLGCDSATGRGRPLSLFRIHPLQRSQRRLETFVLGRFASFGVVGVPLGVESCRNVFR